MGSVKLLEVSRNISHKCIIIVVTTDKVYENKEWISPTEKMIGLEETIPIVQVRLL